MGLLRAITKVDIFSLKRCECDVRIREYVRLFEPGVGAFTTRRPVMIAFKLFLQTICSYSLTSLGGIAMRLLPRSQKR